MENKKVWTKEEIKELLITNPRAVARGVVAIWKFQTEFEKSYGETTEHNGVGFNGVDAGILTSFAEQINVGRTLSVKQLEIASKKIKKYAGQLARIANGELTLPE